jgi:hypothetical protein
MLGACIPKFHPTAGRHFNVERLCAGILAGVGWTAVSIEVALTINNAVSDKTSIAAAVIRCFSYFTIETNMLLAIILTATALRPQADSFFLQPGVKLAGIVYIIIVGVVYATLLRHLWNPQGLRLFADRLLHIAMPVFYPLYWLAFASKGETSRVDPFRWLIYPVVYFIYILARGAVFGLYPYPFLNVAKLGYLQVFLNSLGLLAAFLGLGLCLAGLDRAMGARKSRSRGELGRAAEF